MPARSGVRVFDLEIPLLPHARFQTFNPPAAAGLPRNAHTDPYAVALTSRLSSSVCCRYADKLEHHGP
jgi:hypothetical protein